MTTVTNLSNPSARTAPNALRQDETPSTLDYNAFLQLLIAQLKTQDPTEPMDTAQYMSQLASFSQVEQALKTNAKLDTLLTTSALTQAESLIGRTITSADGRQSGEVSSIKITNEGIMASLKQGGQILLGPGVTIA
jgi:flagellar basal-body rod modification protein FlgD